MLLTPSTKVEIKFENTPMKSFFCKIYTKFIKIPNTLRSIDRVSQ